MEQSNTNQLGHRVEITWRIALRIWGWILWCTLIVVFVSTILVNTLDHYWGHALDDPLIWIIALIAGIATQLYWIKRGGIGFYDRLIEEISQEKNRIENEINLAKRIQSKLLSPIRIQNRYFNIYGETQLAEQVGGDYFEVVELNNKKLAVAVGDVSGHNLAAALLMAMTKTAFLSELNYLSNLPILMGSLNKTITNNSDEKMFVSFLCGVFDFEKMVLTMVNAGHLPLLRFINQDNKIEEITTKSLALGLSKQADYVSREIFFKQGDVFAFITDGLIETVNTAGDEFGMEHMKKTLQDYAETNSPSKIYNGIMKDVNNFSGSDYFKDDVTALVMKVV